MKKIVNKSNLSVFDRKIVETYFKDKRCGVFDIETTGLNFNWDKIILTAILTIENSTATVTQFLAEDPSEEKNIIKATLDYIKSEHIDYLLTYNGASFDIPFFKIKLKKHFEDTFFPYYNLDLYKIFRNHSNLKKLSTSLSQKSMENFMGIGSDRDDIIDGGKSVELYKEFVLTKDKGKEELILTHNREDVFQLYRLLNLLKYCNFHSAMYEYGFLHSSLVVKPKLIKGYLKIVGKQYRYPISIDTFGSFSTNYQANFDSNDRNFEILLPSFEEANGKYVDAHFIKDEKNQLGLINGYLVIEENKIKKHREINIFSMLIINKILSDYGY